MNTPVLRGVIERRLLVNYRAAPDVVAALLPAPFRPQLVRGEAVVGICLIRLGQMRPRWLPDWVGLRSENAAHRIAVEWDDGDDVRTGVYITRRDSGAAANVVVGGRLFPGVHHRADFDVSEAGDSFLVSYAARDGSARVEVDIERVPVLGGSLFTDLDEASAFFRGGVCGWSPGREAGTLDGLALATDRWAIEPAAVRRARSTFFDDPTLFPSGSITLDHALLMRDVPVEWHALPALADARATART